MAASCLAVAKSVCSFFSFLLCFSFFKKKKRVSITRDRCIKGRKRTNDVWTNVAFKGQLKERAPCSPRPSPVWGPCSPVRALKPPTVKVCSLHHSIFHPTEGFLSGSEPWVLAAYIERQLEKSSSWQSAFYHWNANTKKHLFFFFSSSIRSLTGNSHSLDSLVIFTLEFASK